MQGLVAALLSVVQSNKSQPISKESVLSNERITPRCFLCKNLSMSENKVKEGQSTQPKVVVGCMNDFETARI